MAITAERGYLIPAINNGDTDYEKCAELLKASILHWHPNANVTVLTKDMLPHGDLGGYKNDWQLFRASPYRQTIKLEADMLIASPIDHWWTLFEHRDVVISTGCRDFYDHVSNSRSYRKFIDVNHLPDVYNAITYWRLSKTAQNFFDLVRDIFGNWDDYKQLFKFPEDEPTTDFVYAIAAEILGPELVTMPFTSYPKIVHMKKHIIQTRTENWTRELVWERDPLRIQTVAQWGAFHYNIKDWSA